MNVAALGALIEPPEPELSAGQKAEGVVVGCAHA
jgi:hypothetical protein